MRKNAIILFLITSFVSLSYSQFTIGPKSGVNMSKLYNSDIDSNFKFGFHVGGFVKYNFTSSLSVQPELMYSQQSSFIDVSLIDYGGNVYFNGLKITYQYLHLPVLVNCNLGNSHFYLEFGPQLDYHLKSKYSLDNNDFKDDVLNEWKKIVFSAVGGLGYNFNNGLSFSARYCHGLSNSIKKLPLHKNRCIQFSLAYNLSFISKNR